MSMMKALLALASGLGTIAVMVACQSAVNLDVQYTDAGGGIVTTTPPPAPTDAGTGTPEASAPPAPTDAGTVTPEASAPPPEERGEELEACPCAMAQGLACCVSNAGPAFCTTDQARCEGEKGAFLRCFGPDPTTESVCCLRRGATPITGLAGECKADSVTVCRDKNDCPGPNPTCTIETCKDGVTIGVCDGQPVCPPR